MSKPLTQEHFDETMRSIADTLTEHGGRFDQIDATLADHTKRLADLADVGAMRETIRHLETRVSTLESIRNR